MQAEASQQRRGGRPCSNMPFLKLVGLLVPCLFEAQAYSKFSFNGVTMPACLSATLGFYIKLYLVENQAFLKSPGGVFSLCANIPFL